MHENSKVSQNPGYVPWLCDTPQPWATAVPPGVLPGKTPDGTPTVDYPDSIRYPC